ncbi:hypothetical protein CHS0354_008730 [Potamilus streckersoni]|uniref:Uncharacterized protein n=1 Tax=Potamilus streckersoni TaxID=2493646 RepID=A0AAE0TJ51_9BIVA|nr:hypothetical protein CHS0354_008730 [Potamilus streckersoni]
MLRNQPIISYAVEQDTNIVVLMETEQSVSGSTSPYTQFFKPDAVRSSKWYGDLPVSNLDFIDPQVDHFPLSDKSFKDPRTVYLRHETDFRFYFRLK